MIQTVMAQIDTISATHPNPMRAKRQMVEVTKAVQKLTTRVTQKGLIQKLIRMRLALEDVLSIEKKQREQRMMIKIKDQRMINLLMRRKLQDAIAEENKIRREYNNAKTEMYSYVDRRSKVAGKFRNMLNELVTKLFKNNIILNETKIDNLKLEQNNSSPSDLQQTKSTLIDAFDQYTKKHCDKNGDLKEGNMTTEFKEGLKGLKEKQHEIIVRQKTIIPRP